MTFDASAHPRSTDGTFAEKTGAAPEVALGERTRGMELLDSGLKLDGYWGQVADQYGLTLEERGYFAEHLDRIKDEPITPETESRDIIADALQAQIDAAEDEEEREDAIRRQEIFRRFVS